METIKIYFNQEKVALGTIENYYGDYYASEELALDPARVLGGIKGKTHSELQAIAKYQRAEAALDADTHFLPLNIRERHYNEAREALSESYRKALDSAYWDEKAYEDAEWAFRERTEVF
jgi:hypothetical protein